MGDKGTQDLGKASTTSNKVKQEGRHWETGKARADKTSGRRTQRETRRRQGETRPREGGHTTQQRETRRETRETRRQDLGKAATPSNKGNKNWHNGK